MVEYITAIFNINCQQEKEKMTRASNAFKDRASQAESLHAAQ